MSDKYKQYIDKTKNSLIYWQELSILEFTEDLARLLDQQNITQSEFAKKIGKSAPYISKVLNGNVNFTLKTMTKLARALDSVVHVHIAPENAQVHWFDTYSIKYNSGLEENDGSDQSLKLIPSSTETNTKTFSDTLNFLEANDS